MERVPWEIKEEDLTFLPCSVLIKEQTQQSVIINCYIKQVCHNHKLKMYSS